MTRLKLRGYLHGYAMITINPRPISLRRLGRLTEHEEAEFFSATADGMTLAFIFQIVQIFTGVILILSGLEIAGAVMIASLVPLQIAAQVLDGRMKVTR